MPRDLGGSAAGAVWPRVEHVRADGDDDLVDGARGSVPGTWARRCRSGRRSRTRSCYVLDASRCSRCRSGCRASCSSVATVWRAATRTGPELTAERFVADPFDARRARGCIGRVMWPAGCRTATSEFLGRADHQVKVRGHRIELGEIEAHAGRASGGRVGGGHQPGSRRRGCALGRLLRAADEDAVEPRRVRTTRDAVCPATWSRRLRAAGRLPADAEQQDRPQRAAPPRAGTAARQRGETPARDRAPGPAGRASGPRSSGGPTSASTTTSSTSAATASSPPRSSRGSVPGWGWRCRCGPCSSIRRSPVWPSTSQADRDGADREPSTLPEISRGDRSLPFPLSGPQERMWFIHQLHPEGSALQHGRRPPGPGPARPCRAGRGHQRCGGAPRGAADASS